MFGSVAASPSWLRRLAVIAAAGKRRSPCVARFLIDIDRLCIELAAELVSATYRPGRGHAFRIADPKPRLIYALPFRDRVAQHFLLSVTLPAVERGLSSQTYACRSGKGTHRCLNQAAALARTRSWVLRVDVRKFFPSIDHEILRRLLCRSTPPEWRWLRDRFLDAPSMVERTQFSFPGDDLFAAHQRPHGLPIGSLTSQIWANVYMSPVDHLLASHLGIGSFVRYCDDLLIFHDDPGLLRAALDAVQRRALELRLRLHPDKTRLYRTTEAVSFLGFVLQRRGAGVQIRLRHDNVVRMRRRVRTLKRLFSAGAIEPDEVTARLSAWLAHARHGHTRALVHKESERWAFSRVESSSAGRVQP